MNKSSLVSFSLPSFHENFSEETGITDEALSKLFNEQLKLFSTSWAKD